MPQSEIETCPARRLASAGVENEHQAYLSGLKLNRAQAVQVIAAGLVLAVGVNLVASYLSATLSSSATLWLGIGTIVAAVLVILGRVLRPRPRVREFQGFFILDREDNMLVEHDFEYELGSALKRYIDAAFAESDSMKAIWDRNPLFNESNHGDPRKSLALIRQAVEYFVLEQLSTRLTDHFRSGDFNEDELETLSHKDIPDVLLENRFLRLFAEPMEDRAAFAGEDEESSEGGWTTIVANSPSGAFYSRFELVLPRGWRVKRLSRRSIEFNAKRFTLAITTECNGSGEVLPFGYVSDYLGLGEQDSDGIRFPAVQVSVSIRIAPHRAWLLRPRGWRYYRWIDEWIAELESRIDLLAYLDRIGYPTAETVFKFFHARGTRDSSSESIKEWKDTGRDPAAQRKHADWHGIASSFSTGDPVEHAQFGRGTVVDIDENIVTVQFENDDATRRLLFSSPLRFARVDAQGATKRDS